jgi:hypothetical protein
MLTNNHLFVSHKKTHESKPIMMLVDNESIVEKESLEQQIENEEKSEKLKKLSLYVNACIILKSHHVYDMNTEYKITMKSTTMQEIFCQNGTKSPVISTYHGFIDYWRDTFVDCDDLYNTLEELKKDLIANDYIVTFKKKSDMFLVVIIS